MRIGKIFQISLASKCQILFGVAVIIIITTALLVPWLYMSILVSELNINMAKQAALTVQSRYRLETQDWSIVQQDLNETWSELSRELGLTPSVPQLISVPSCDGPVSAQLDSFSAAAVEQLCEHPEAYEAQRIEDIPNHGPLTRYALAIRSNTTHSPSSGLKGVVVVSMAAQDLWGYANLYQMVMIGAAFVAGLLAIVVFYLITHYLILSPVRDLKGVAKRIVSGETALRSEIDTGDEFEDLGEAFNEMLAHLNASQEELKKMNKSLDIKLGELAETNVALFEANRLKGEFLANVSHELRTPLTSIIGFAELLRDASDIPTKADPEKVKRFCNNILTSGRMLLDIINDLLDLAKIEAGKMKLHRTRFPLVDVCEAVVDFTRPLADKKKLQVDLIMPGESLIMHSDAGKIQQIIYNLISNAIKFTPAEGKISIQVDGPDDWVELRIKDSGPGIAKEMHEVIFEKFRQLDGSVTREHGGTGLGLAITRELTHMMGGSIRVHSDAGHGAEFVVCLPRECPEQADIPLVRLN